MPNLKPTITLHLAPRYLGKVTKRRHTTSSYFSLFRLHHFSLCKTSCHLRRNHHQRKSVPHRTKENSDQWHVGVPFLRWRKLHRWSDGVEETMMFKFFCQRPTWRFEHWKATKFWKRISGLKIRPRKLLSLLSFHPSSTPSPATSISKSVPA